jgi:MFS family permease
MLKRNGVGRLSLRWGPTGLALGTRRLHYAWVIVAIASAMGMISSSVRFATSVLVPHLRDPAGFGWSYGAIAFAFTLQWFVSGLVSPGVGWLGDRYGVRRILVLGACLFTAGMLLTGTMTHLWQFYLFFGVLLGMATTIFQILLISGVTLWFRKNLGVAMGILWGSQGIGTILLIPLMVMVFNRLGLQWTFWLPGLVGGTLMLSLIRPVYNEPAELGLRPLGAPENEPMRRLQKDDTAKLRARVFLRQAQRTATFWNLIGIHFWGCAGHNIINVFLVAIAMDRGLSQEMAVGVFLTQTVVGTIGRCLIPVIADRIGSKRVWSVCFSLQVFPLLILLVAHEAWAFHLFAVLFAIGQAGEVPTFPIINRQYYGNAPQGALYGWQNIGNGLGMGLGPVIGGFLWDLTGDYAAAVGMSFVFSLVGLSAVLLLPSTARRLLANWEEALPPEARSSV